MIKRYFLLVLLTMIAVGALAYNGRIVDSEQYNRWSSSQYYKQGIKALKDMDYDAAIEQLSKELKQNPDNGYACVNLAQCMIDKAVYERAKVESDDDPEAEIMATDNYVAVMTEALKTMEEGVRLLPVADKQSQCDTYMALSMDIDVMALFDKGDSSADSVRSEQYLRKAVDVHPCYTSCMTLMKRCYRNNSYNSIKDVIETFYENCPDKVESHFYKALLLEENGEYNEELSVIDNYLKSNSNDMPDKDLLIQKTHALEKLGRNEEAVDLLLQMVEDVQSGGVSDASDRIVEMSVDSPDMVLMKIRQREFAEIGHPLIWDYLQANIYRYALKDYSSALHYYGEMKGFVSDMSLLSNDLAYCYYMNGNDEEALLYSNAYDYISGNTSYYNTMLRNLGEFDTLIDQQKTILSLSELHDADGNDYVNLANLYVAKRDFDNALPILEKALQLNDSLPLANYYYGVVLKQKGRNAEARGYFEKSLKCNYENMVPYGFIVPPACKIELGQPAEALSDIELLAADWQKGKSAKTMKDNVKSMTSAYEIACLYSLLGDSEHALKYLLDHFEYDVYPYNFRQMELDWRLDNIRALPAYELLIEKYQNRIRR